MKVVALLLYFVSVYFTYYKSCKHKSNPYFWLGIGLLFPFISVIVVFFRFRGREVINPSPSMLPLGYRSKTRWKMIFSSVVYGLFVLVISISIFADTSNTTTNALTVQQNEHVLSYAATSTGGKALSTQQPANSNSDQFVSPQGLNETSNHLLKVHYIDVGQADSILVQTPSGKVMLIDAGNNADGDMIVSYLKSQGIGRIDILVGTHPHEDHIGGMDTVINGLDIGKIYIPNVANNTKTFEDVLTAIKNKGLKVTAATAGITIDLDPAVQVLMLAPNRSNYENSNDDSAIIKLIYNNNSFLFAGDAQDDSEREILAKGFDIRADVLKVGHHGSNTSTSSEFLKAVSPRYAVISVGKGNDYGHPDQVTLDKLSQANVQVLRTDEEGTIVATSDGNTIKLDKSASAIKPQAPPVQTPDSSDSSKLTSSSSSSKANNNDVIVYVTHSGEKYHADGCKYLSKSKIATKLSAAKAEGYTPCKACHPPQ